MSVFTMLKKQIKEQQKEKAAAIHTLKQGRKPSVYNLNPGLYVKLGNLSNLRYDYRHIHIAYCEFFNGTEYEEIERTCDDPPSQSYIDRLKFGWNSYIKENTDETVCVSAV